MRLLSFALALIAITPLSAAGAQTFDNPGFDADASGWSWTSIDSNGGWRSYWGNPGGMFIVNHAGWCATDPTLEQTVTGLIPGHTYLVTVDRMAFSDTGADTFGILVDGAAIGTTTGPVWSWAPFGASFTATGTEHVIGFSGEMNCYDTDYAVDNAAIADITPTVPTPELSTIGLFGIGLVVLGCFVFGRRR